MPARHTLCRRVLVSFLLTVLVVVSLLHFRPHQPNRPDQDVVEDRAIPLYEHAVPSYDLEIHAQEDLDTELILPEPPPLPHLIYKSDDDRVLAQRPFIPVLETFPRAAVAKYHSDLPRVPSWNRPPKKHVPEATPIFIAFTRNWPVLQQAVVSLISAGWPPSDIYVVENTGTMLSNAKGHLSLQNPFYLDYHRLRNIFGVNVITLPNLQTFSQVQNFFLFESVRNGWEQYLWAHMDVLVTSNEDVEPYKSFYLKCVDALRQSRSPKYGKWGTRFFAYDWVTLMNTAAMVELGGWDPMISYYTSDCDMYERMHLAGMKTEEYDAGIVYDVGESLEDLEVLYRQAPGRNASLHPLRRSWLYEDARNSSTYHSHRLVFETLSNRKLSADRLRWQWAQMGGQGEPFYRDMDGFQEALEITKNAGMEVFDRKWRSRGCSIGLVADGFKLGDEWAVERVEVPRPEPEPEPEPGPETGSAADLETELLSSEELEIDLETDTA